MARLSSRMSLFGPVAPRRRRKGASVTHSLRLCSRAPSPIRQADASFGTGRLKVDRIERGRMLAGRLDLPPAPACEARLSADFGRRFLIVGDAEEEFDWG